jgi:membrane fusion protein, copper/silver efflux system
MKSLKSLIVGTMAVGLLVMGRTTILAHGNDRGLAKATIDKAQVSIDYGRPTLKGRDMLKKMAPGSLWRLGSDAATTIESNVDLDFGGTRVPKGKHILLARLVEPGKWTLVVSSKSAVNYEPSAKIAEVPMEFSEATDPVEELTIQLLNSGGNGVIEVNWGTARLKATFAVAK